MKEDAVLGPKLDEGAIMMDGVLLGGRVEARREALEDSPPPTKLKVGDELGLATSNGELHHHCVLFEVLSAVSHDLLYRCEPPSVVHHEPWNRHEPPIFC